MSAMPDLAKREPVLDRDYGLDHKYTRERGRIYLSGVQALVRLPLMQQLRDRAAGLSTGIIAETNSSSDPCGSVDERQA